MTPWPDRPERSMSRALVRITLLLALTLGTLAALVQLGTDLHQEKIAVERQAEELLDGVAPSAASAVYNYYIEAAEQVVEGMFTQRAVRRVLIVGDGAPVVVREREVTPTLPALGALTRPDEIVLRRELVAPPQSGYDGVIGRIEVTVDRSVVPPTVVDRMFLYFLLAAVKNILLGILLVVVVFGSLTRHVIALADAVARWRPGAGAVDLPPPPRFLRRTELDLLGERIVSLSAVAEGTISSLERSRDEAQECNSKLNLRSQTLSRAVEERTKKLRAANRKLEKLAHCDMMTGLFNRGYFDTTAGEVLEGAAAENRRVAILLIDVDHFKAYNDQYGHQAGDECLRRVASCLTKAAGDDDVVVARYGGEEFIVLIPDAARCPAADLAKAIGEQVAEEEIPHARATAGPCLTVSIGIAEDRADAETSLEMLTAAADEALYQAKSNGRARVEVASERTRKAMRRRRVEIERLRDAIDRRAFEPHFQAQVDARTGDLVGVEALVRADEMTMPENFIPRAREIGVVHLIDRVVLEKSLEMLERWSREGLGLPRLSLNTSLQHLVSAELVSMIEETSRRTNTPIGLELLESEVFDEPSDTLVWHLDRLREVGIEIEIDDFGTGHTSILGLMRLQPRRLKIARELVLPIVEDAAQRRVVASVIEIGKALDVSVVAEGVETEAHAEALLDLGCPIQQGYAYGRPMAPDALAEHLRAMKAGVVEPAAAR